MNKFIFSKKIFIVAAILIISWLFYSGIMDFFFQDSTKDQSANNNNQNVVLRNNTILPKQKIKERGGTGILQNISDAIKAPFMKASIAFIESDAVNLIKASLENYFLASSKIDFPDPQLISDAIILHKQGKDEAIKLLIEVLKERNKELYAIIPPPEAETIHNNSLWISGKFIEILEKVLKTDNEQEILKILDSPETREMQEIAESAKKEINDLIKTYGLETKI